MPISGTIAIVPMKPLALAKTRLSGELTPAQRAAISRNMLRRVLQAVVGLGLGKDSPVEDVWVVGGDPDIDRIATKEGAKWLEEEGNDINESLWLAFRRAFDSGKAALFMPGDLPFLKPKDVYGMVGASGRLKNVTLSPARRSGGTNGILVPPDLPQPFHPLLGPNSFKRHLAQAVSLGVSAAIYHSPGLAFDLDTAEDLRAYEFMEPGLLDKLTEGMTGDAGG